MTVIATGEIDLRLSPQSQSRLENDITGATKKASTKAGAEVAKSFKGAGVALSASFAAVGAVKIFGSLITEATEAAKVGRLTEAVIKSTGGVAGVTAKDIENLATKLSNVAAVDDDLIQSGLNVLATFTNVANIGKDKIFDEAAKSAVNMSAALGTDLQGTILQVGKALNDPIKGITALSRAGVSFTEDQKKTIKSLVETGDVLGAQKIILAELAKEFSGAAAAAADPAARLKVSFDNVKESLGTALLPIIQKVSDIFINLSPGMQQVVVVGGLLAGTAVVLAPALAALIPIIAGISAASVLAALPWIALGAAAALLAVVIIKNWDTINAATQVVWQAIQSAVSAAWEGIKAVVSAAFDFLTFLFLNFTGPGLLIHHWESIKAAASAAFDVLKGIVSGAVNAITAVLGGIGRIAGAVFDPLLSAARSVFNAIARAWNATVGKISFKIPGWVPGIGGKGFDVPNIPTFHQGGVFKAPFGQQQGLALLRDREIVFTPEQLAMLSGRSMTNNFTIVDNTGDPEVMAFVVSRKLGMASQR